MADGTRFSRDVEDRQIAMFASFVGRGCHTTLAALSRASGVPDGTLRSYASGAAMPLHAVLAIRPHLPAAAINMLFEPGGVRLCCIEEEATNWNAVAASAAGLTFEICDAQADGVIDHVERARLRGRARGLAAQLSSLTGDE